MKETISKFFGKHRKHPLEPDTKLETKQKSLKDFNISRLNNNTSGGAMKQLDVDSVSLERGDVYDEEE